MWFPLSVYVDDGGSDVPEAGLRPGHFPLSAASGAQAWYAIGHVPFPFYGHVEFPLLNKIMEML